MSQKKCKHGDLAISCPYPECYQDCTKEKAEEQTKLNDKVSTCWVCGRSINGTESYPFCDSICEGTYVGGNLLCYD